MKPTELESIWVDQDAIFLSAVYSMKPVHCIWEIPFTSNLSVVIQIVKNYIFWNITCLLKNETNVYSCKYKTNIHVTDTKLKKENIAMFL